ncbi:MAG: calcium:proton antiporter, partial [Devosia nanyangense]|nr:calcium:proton antiporter [Devosia nanyangense]
MRHEWPSLLAAIAGLVAFNFEHQIMEAGSVASLLAAAVLIATIVMASVRVAHHAEILAAKVGDPYGTMILTLSAVAVEVLVLGILM